MIDKLLISSFCIRCYTYTIVLCCSLFSGTLTAQVLPKSGPPATIAELKKMFLGVKSHDQSAVKNNTSQFLTAKSWQKQQVASNATLTACYDTSLRVLLKTDTSMEFFSRDPILLADGGSLLLGEYAEASLDWGGGLAMKFDHNGNLLWNKAFDTIGQFRYMFLYYTTGIELPDKSIILAGFRSIPNAAPEAITFTKIDENGNVIWTRSYDPSMLNVAQINAIQELKRDPQTGHIYVCGSYSDIGSFAAKLDPASGDILWANAYKSSGNNEFSFGIDVQPTELRLFCRNNADTSSYVSIYRLDKNSGDTIQTRFYKSNDPDGMKTQFYGTSALTKLDNGHYAISGTCYEDTVLNWNGGQSLNHGAVLEFDNNLNPVNAFCMRNEFAGYGFFPGVNVFPDGSGYCVMRKFNSDLDWEDHFVHFKNGQITHQRMKHYVGTYASYITRIMSRPDGDVNLRILPDDVGMWRNVEFMRMHDYDTSSTCLGITDNSSSIFSFSYSEVNCQRGIINHNIFSPVVLTPVFTRENAALTAYPDCSQILHCDSLKLISDTGNICMPVGLQVIARKNPGCNNPVYWNYDSAVASLIQVNDTTVKFQFNQSWSGYIYANLDGCTIMKDSIHLNILSVNNSIDIGPDEGLCLGSTIILNAHSGFTNYLWQNNPGDSVFTVTSPGTYFVQANALCGGTYYDTVIISAQQSTPLYIEPYRSICKNDTLHLDAPAGFANYQWSPDYHLSATTTASVIANPLIDTAYFLKAENGNHCFSFDTIHISVLASPANFLPGDTVSCLLQPFTLHPGQTYSSYLWNTGSTTESIDISEPGLYWLLVENEKHCFGTDTILIKEKQCIDGFYMPSAFTPNSDSRNDKLAPVLPNNILSYTFRVFNRYGQVLFQSNIAGKGWDGSFNHLKQLTGAYIWTCTYEESGRKEKNIHGVVLLIR